MSTRVLIDRSLDHLSKCWHSLVRTDLIYKLLAFCLFSPVFSLLLGYALALSGNRVLTDLDIVHFIAGPLGLLISVLLGAIWLGLLAIEQASMLVILAITSIALNVLASISFAILLYGCFREFCPEWSPSLGATNLDSYSKPTARYLLTKSRMIFGGFIGLLAVALIGFWAVESLELTDHTQVMAHRGSSKAAPENSLAAIQQAIEDRSDWVEIDVQETLDGQVVVVHDSDLMKLAKSPRKIWETTSQEIGSIDIGGLFEPKFSNERVPNLEEVLNLCRDRIGVIIELKYYGHDQRLEQRVVELVERTGMTRQVMIMSLKPEGIRKLRALRPTWKCGLLLSVAVGDLKTVEADFLAVNAKIASRAMVQQIHSAGKQIFVWTVDEPATMSSLMNRGVDGILTNRPEIARGVIESRAQMSLTERLLTELAAMLRADKKQIPEEP